MTTFCNLTPHAVTIVSDDGDAITIAPSGTIARLSTRDQDAGTIAGIPIVVRRTAAITGLPDPVPGHVYIVSAMVAEAAAGRTDVLAPDTGPTAIRDADGRITAVRRLVRYA